VGTLVGAAYHRSRVSVILFRVPSSFVLSADIFLVWHTGRSGISCWSYRHVLIRAHWHWLRFGPVTEEVNLRTCSVTEQLYECFSLISTYYRPWQFLQQPSCVQRRCPTQRKSSSTPRCGLPHRRAHPPPNSCTTSTRSTAIFSVFSLVRDIFGLISPDGSFSKCIL
jgi:hypothetical protein